MQIQRGDDIMLMKIAGILALIIVMSVLILSVITEIACIVEDRWMNKKEG